MNDINNEVGNNIIKNNNNTNSGLKLDTYNWLSDIPQCEGTTDYVEVTFKNTRKGYYRNTNDIKLVKGDIVAVEATPGHDIGTVSLTGPLVLLQMKKYRIDAVKSEIRRIYRKAKQSDIDTYEQVKALEHETMIEARKIAESLHLNMKIGDVEYQGDGNKAIFYYIADERVDFRQLIKVLAETFKVRIEMKQIGARQEAGRIGGIGPCGRPLCCSAWMSNFVSVSTNAARFQDISPNPQKLAGQCAKLKCCMNFEIDSYMEAQKEFPPKDVTLETIEGTYYFFKADILARTVQYSTAPHSATNLVTISAARARQIVEINRTGEKVVSLTGDENTVIVKEKVVDYQNVVGQDSLTRFDKKKKKKNKNRNGNRDNQSVQSVQAEPSQSNSQDNVAAPEPENKPVSSNGHDNNRRNNEGRNRNRNGQRREETAVQKNEESNELNSNSAVQNGQNERPSRNDNRQRRNGNRRFDNRNRSNDNSESNEKVQNDETPKSQNDSEKRNSDFRGKFRGGRGDKSHRHNNNNRTNDNGGQNE